MQRAALRGAVERAMGSLRLGPEDTALALFAAGIETMTDVHGPFGLNLAGDAFRAAWRAKVEQLEQTRKRSEPDGSASGSFP